jgi:Na+/H+ antiporter NhaD/arsenite permease-like protein
LILTTIISNSAGLLTLVGDPATFLVGSSIGMTFSQYLARVSLGGLMSVLALIPIMPWVMRDIWSVRRTLPERIPDTKLDRPMFCILALIVLITMILLFLFGENLPFQIIPPSVAIIAASLALLVIYCTRVEPLVQVIRDVDWSTLIFISCMFLMVEAFTRTGILYSLSRNMSTWFGTNLLLIAMIMLFGVGIVSSLLANIPVVAAMILVVKGYLVAAEFVPEIALGPSFMDWPTLTIPVFVAMMFGGTLGGNATLIGASANIVSAGISASHGRPISFVMFARYGIPITFCQLFLSALYVLVLHAVIGM